MPVFMPKSHSYIKQKVTKMSEFNQATPNRPLCQFLNHTNNPRHWRLQEYFSEVVKKLKLNNFFLKKNLNISSYRSKKKKKKLKHKILQFPFISFYIFKQLCNSSLFIVIINRCDGVTRGGTTFRLGWCDHPDLAIFFI